MMRYLITLFLVLPLASSAWGQNVEESRDIDATEVEIREQEDDLDLDEQGYENEEEDDFIPSQEISADKSLAFPVDI
ncbi:hypothetical protein OAI75_03605 [Woeseiaceae bacterium]|jgi:hypothetical protein|nr:hypothetical protein [Woeseiaceae bacterium]